MHETFTLIIEYAIEKLAVNTIIGKTLTKNKQAIRMAQKTGFKIQQVIGEETILIKACC